MGLYMGIWVYGYMDIWVYGYKYGHMGIIWVWMSGYILAYGYGCLGVWVLVWGQGGVGSAIATLDKAQRPL